MITVGMTRFAVAALLLLAACSGDPPKPQTWALWGSTETWNQATVSTGPPDAQSTTKLEGGLERLVCETLRDRAERDNRRANELLHELRVQAAAVGIRRQPEPVSVKRYACKAEADG
jgi:hypothetical protein